jgi:hypothetical protein
VNAGFVVEKTLASALADAFSQHLPAWEPSATLYLLPKISDEVSQGHLHSRMCDAVSESRSSSLVKEFENTAPAWLAQAQPCVYTPSVLSAPILPIRGSKK